MLDGFGGGYAEYAVIPEKVAAPVPDRLPDEQTAAVPLAPLTALQALRALSHVWFASLRHGAAGLALPPQMDRGVGATGADRSVDGTETRGWASLAGGALPPLSAEGGRATGDARQEGGAAGRESATDAGG